MSASRTFKPGPAAAGVVVALALGSFVPAVGGNPLSPWMAAVAGLMAVWWVTEALPIPVTSLVPLALLPLFGIASLKTVAPNYAKPIAFLFLGGFMLALALEQSGLHRRFARAIMSIVGSRPRRLLLGFMIASGSLSMWISNTASVMVMLPIGLSVLHAASDRLEGSERLRFSTAVMLGIAYAANIGGMATPVGTPPNLVFLEVSRQAFPAAPEFSFAQWMSIGLPNAVLFIGVAWSLLAFVVFRLPNEPLFDEDPAPLGPVSRDEWASGLIFAAAALLWVTGSDLQVGGAKLTGWRSSLNLPQATDGVVAIACALLLFVVPSAERSGETLLKWETTQHKLPWSLLLLFGGGFALAAGFKSTGLSSGVAQLLVDLKDAPGWLLVGVVCFALTFLTELTSNTATTTLVLPVLADAGPALGVHPWALMIPATLSASCAFMMPVSSPTQAIVFGTGHIPIKEMARAGIWLNLAGVLVVLALFSLFGESVLGHPWTEVPAWASRP